MLTPLAIAQSGPAGQATTGPSAQVGSQDGATAKPGVPAVPSATPLPVSEPWPIRRTTSGPERVAARLLASNAGTAPTPDELRAKLTRNPVRLVSAGKPLGDLHGSIEAALGVRVTLTSGAANLPVNGEIAGDDGMSFVRELAARVRLEWAFGLDGLFMAPEGSSRPTNFTASSPEAASRAAAQANQEFEPLGSGIRVVARKEEVSVTGIPAWVNQVASLRMPILIDAAERTVPKEDRASRDKPAAPTEPLSLMVFRLSNAFVDDKRVQVGSYVMIIPGVATLFRQFTGLRGGTLGVAAPSRDTSVTRVPRVDPLAGSRAYLRGEADDAGDRPARRERQGREEPQERLEAVRPDEPVVIADSRMNTLIVRDRASMLEPYRALVKVLDQTAEMVQLDAFIIDVKASRLDEFGIGLSWAGTSSVTSPGLLPGGSVPAGANVILQGARGAQLLAQVRALETLGDSEILTVPSVVTLNNLEATFSARESFYVKVSGNLDTSLNEVTAETLLKVTPLLTQQPTSASNGTNRLIRLLISVQDGSVDASASAVVDNLPRTMVNQISTQALVRGGDTLVIGGQVVRKRVNRVSGLPILKDIPILGPLTRSRSDQFEQYVRIYVVRPRILGDGSVALNDPVPDERSDPLVSGTLKRVPELIRGSGLSPRGLDADRPAGAGSTTEGHFVVPVPRPEPQGPQPTQPPALSPSPAPRPTAPAPTAPATTTVPAAVAPTAAAPADPSPGPVASAPVAPTAVAPTAVAPTTAAPTTAAPTAVAPTAVAPTAVAPTTVAPTTAAPTTAAPAAGTRSAAVSEIVAAVKAWAQAWSERDTQAYAAAYAPEFKGSAPTRTAWLAERKARIENRSRISVTVSDLKVASITDDKARVRFLQTYLSDSSRSRGHKTLTLQRVDGDWLILEESGG